MPGILRRSSDVKSQVSPTESGQLLLCFATPAGSQLVGSFLSFDGWAQAFTSVGESASLGQGGGPITLVEGTSFCLSGRSGDIRPDLPEGLFFLDTRLLSDWQLRVDGLRPEPLAVTTEAPNAATFVSRVRRHRRSESGSLLIVRRRHVGRGMHEDLSIRNYGTATRGLVVVMFSDVDFADLFDVKLGSGASPPCAYPPRAKPVSRLPTSARSDEPHGDADVLRAAGVGSGCRGLGVGDSARRRMDLLRPGRVAVGGERISPEYRCGEPSQAAEPALRRARWQQSVPRLGSDHAPLVEAAGSIARRPR